jgi:hypothetical protein
LPFPFPPLSPTPSLFHPTPPPAFNLGNPRTWIPNTPSLAPPPPPEFNLRDPRTWIPYIPPSPPNNPQNQNPWYSAPVISKFMFHMLYFIIIWSFYVWWKTD